MELKNLWNEIGEAEFGGRQLPDETLDHIRQSSRHPLETLRKRLYQKFIWGVGIGLAFLGFAIYAIADSAGSNEDLVTIWTLLGLMIILSTGLTWPVWKAYRSLPRQVDLSGDVLSVMKQYRDTVQRIIRLEDIFAYIMAVPSPTLGALLGMVSEGESIRELIESGEIWVPLIIGVIVAPLVVWLTKKMNKIAFGAQMKEVEALIASLENEENEA